MRWIDCPAVIDNSSFSLQYFIRYALFNKSDKFNYHISALSAANNFEKLGKWAEWSTFNDGERGDYLKQLIVGERVAPSRSLIANSR